MNFLEKIQKQPEKKRKLILWTVVIIVGIGLVIFWAWSSRQKTKEFSKEKFIEGFDLPSLKAKMNKLPKIEIPSSSEQTRKEAK